MQIMITRSEDWVRNQRLARGENVPVAIQVAVDPASLSEAAREVWLQAGSGKYTDLEYLRYNSGYEISQHGGYGQEDITIDEDAPTPAQIGVAMIVASLRVERKRQEADQRKAERQADERAKQEEQKAKDAAIKVAREVLAPMLTQLEADLAEAKLDVVTLSEFIAAIPADTKRGALKKLAEESTEATAVSLRSKIEDAAAAMIYVLGDLDSEDDD